MKKRLMTLLILAGLLLISGCSTYTCAECGDKTTKAYYNMSADLEWVMCEDCARSYWAPFPYENYRVK